MRQAQRKYQDRLTQVGQEAQTRQAPASPQRAQIRALHMLTHWQVHQFVQVVN